jgi:dolichol-phosphate mannosyltransferase
LNPDQRILSVIIPIFNEERTVFALLKKVMEVQLVEGFSLELILVDDCSSDESSLRIQEFIDAHPEVQEVRHITHAHNQGKGAAVRTGLQHVTGNYVLIQDADLELDPQDFNLLLGPIYKEGPISSMDRVSLTQAGIPSRCAATSWPIGLSPELGICFQDFR